MDIKILSSLENVPENRHNMLIIGTHNGKFHSDDVVACALLCLPSPNTIQIVRTRNAKILAQCDICVDIGGGKFDHHQSGFNKTRENGVKYASAGLVWEQYGEFLIDLSLRRHFPEAKCNIKSIFKTFDDSVISLVDREDNGKFTGTHCFSFISSFLPWFSNNLNDFDEQFYEVLIATISVIKQELKKTIGKEIAENIIGSNWNNPDYFSHGILEIPSQTMLWEEPTITINAHTKTNKINFVIFPYPNGGWAAQCVPPCLANLSGQRMPFPLEWAGETDKLAEISGVKGATLCHNGRFFARASSKKAIIQMCELATQTSTTKDA